MPRILGVDLPKNKRIDVALRYLYGIGTVTSNRVLVSAKVDFSKRAGELTDEEIARLTQELQANYKLEGDLRREVAGNIKRLIDIGTYRGLRHKKGLPVRGQRTRTNSRSRKGPRPRVGVRKRTTRTATASPQAARSTAG